MKVVGVLKRVHQQLHSNNNNNNTTNKNNNHCYHPAIQDIR